MNRLPTRLLLLICATVGGLLAIGQLIPVDSSQVATGDALPQVLLWLVTWTLFVLTNVLTKQKQSLSPKLLIVIGCMVGTIGWLLLSVWHVSGNGNVRSALNGWWQWVAWLAMFCVLLQFISINRSPRLLASWMIALSFLVTLHSFYQVFISMPLDRERFRINPQEVLAEAGISANPGTSTYLLFEGRLQDSSPTGPFALTNSLAGFIVPWIVILFATGLDKILSRKQPQVTWATTAGFCVAVLMLWVLIMTKSRTAWIALLLGIGICLWNHPTIASYRKRFLYPALGMIIVVAMFGGGLIYWWDWKVLMEAPQSLAYRIDYWQATLRMAGDHLWFGVGPGNFQTYYATYKSLGSSETVADPHNFLLETLAIGGLPALVGIVLTIIATYRLGVCQSKPVAIDNEVKVQSDLSTDASTAMIFGGFCGLGLVWFSFGILGPWPSPEPYMVGIPIIAGYFLLCWRNRGLVDDLSSPPIAGIGAALIAMAVHLLASGGWMTPGIGNSLAVLAAIWISSKSQASPALEPSIEETVKPISLSKTSKKKNSRGQRRLFEQPLSLLGMISPPILLLAFYHSTWEPTQQLAIIKSRLSEETRSTIHGNPFELATRADSLAPDAFRILAAQAYRMVGSEFTSRQISPSLSISQSGAFEKSIQAARRAAGRFLEKDRANWQSWSQCGNWELELAKYHPESLSVALQNYQQALSRAC